jgi:CRP-like cAMP-binding protein
LFRASQLLPPDTANDSHTLALGDLPEGLGSLQVFRRGAKIWESGQTIGSVFFIRRGQVCLVVQDEKGRDVITRIIRPTEPFGLTFFNGQRRSAAVTTAVAAMRCEIVEVSIEAFRAFLRTNDAALTALLSTIADCLAYAEERIRILSNHDAEDRLCALLEQLTVRTGRPSRRVPDLSTLEFTHAELGELAGLSRAHVSVVMGRLRDKALVQYSRSTPLLVNLQALAERRKQALAAGRKLQTEA